VKKIVLRHALAARPTASDFAIVDAPPPEIQDDGVLARVVHLSLDPYVGSRLRGRHLGEAPPIPGVEPIPGGAVVQIVGSNSSMFKAGDWAHTMDGGWAELIALPASKLRHLDPAQAPLRAHVSSLGMPGLTAWAGVRHLANIGAGDVFLVDAAAGAVGGTAGQIARLRGARVIGIAGGAEKCRLVREAYKFDACVDYTAPDWLAALDRALPKPPTVIFENVSVAMLTHALSRAALYARVVLCGLVDQYHAEAPPPQIPAGLIIGKRACLMGLVVYDFYDRWDAFLGEVAPLVREGSLAIAEDVVRGLDQAPALFEKLMEGRNVGKCIVEVAPEGVP
jgi:NADPH-dependent curcumin reductase